MVLVLPLVRSAATLRKAHTQIRKHFTGPISVLAVIMDGRNMTSYTSSNPGVSSALVEVNGEQICVDYLVDAAQDVLSPDHWLVKAATSIESGQRDDDDAGNPSVLGMWSLFAEYGVGLESPVPLHREPILRMPNLTNLDRWDSHWLGECSFGSQRAQPRMFRRTC